MATTYFSNIIQKATPTASNHLVTKGYVDDNKVDISSVAPAWATGTEYGEGDYVVDESTIYHCTGDHTASASNRPTASEAFWEETTIEEMIAQKIAEALADSGKYVGTITGDGESVTFNVTHNLNSNLILTEVIDGVGNSVYPNVQRINSNTIQLQFGQVPGNGVVYTIIVLK